LQDPDDARGQRWDAVAAAAIGGALPSGLVMGLSQPADLADIDLTPGSDVLVDGDAPELRMACQLWVVGLRLRLLLGKPTLPIPRTAWWTVDAGSGSLRGPGSMWAVIAGRAQTANRLTSQSVEPPSGHSSRLPTGDTGTRLFLQSAPPRR
jgi:hypothetical protein